MVSFDFVSPATPDEAIAELRASGPGETVVLAGGTDLLFDLEDGRTAARRIVSLRRLPWRTLDWNGPSLTIGSTLSLRSLERDPGVRERIPGLHSAVRAVGSVALRHSATLGGNLGRSAPASDLVPILLALDAEVDLLGAAGDRRMSVDRFVLGSRRTALAPGELIRSIRIPEARPSAYLWQRVRPFHDISHMAVAVAFSPSRSRWRVAVSGFPPRPLLVPEAEEALGGPDPGASEVGRAADLAATRTPIVADRRASEAYRRQLVRPLLARAIHAARPSPRSP
ncbi:MAG TPA: FAD binding domain-containing protein [Thermoplasmata archaeon]|nr:FAD binding domain-containing protein [Thermoplasmata archaeon]